MLVGEQTFCILYYFVHLLCASKICFALWEHELLRDVNRLLFACRLMSQLMGKILGLTD